MKGIKQGKKKPLSFALDLHSFMLLAGSAWFVFPLVAMKKPTINFCEQHGI